MDQSVIRKIGVLLVAAFAVLNPVPSWAEYSSTLVTANTVLVIHSRCEEGVVGCDDVTLTGVNRKTGETIHLKGYEVHSTALNGAPGAFQGYSFEDGGTLYVVGHNVLSVVVNEKVVLQEAAAEVP